MVKNMNRLTKKNDKKYFKENIACPEYNDYEQFIKDRPYRIDHHSIEVETKLGKLEDIMEKYNIDDSVEELDNVLAMKYFIGGMRSGGKTLMNKGILYNKISEQLGCPLEVMFKALEEGIHIQAEFLDLTIKDFILKPRLYFSDDFKCYCLETGYGANMIKLKDYQKTWWLKGEKNNE